MDSNSPPATDSRFEPVPGSPAPEPPVSGEPRSAGPSAEARLAISLWLIYHLVGIIIAPAALTFPSPPLYGVYQRLYAPYLVTLFMTHGHRFFAPEPDSGTILRWEVERAEGTTLTGEFPNRSIRPRLLYHRYFMLSERSLGKADEQAWYRGYARHLIRKHDGVRIKLSRVTHELPAPEEIQQGLSLEDDELYVVEELGNWTRDELDQEEPADAS